MLKSKWFFRSLGMLVVLSLILSACKPVRSVVDEYHTLIEAYQAGRKAAANGTSCLVLAFSQMEAQTTLMNNYLVADIEKARAYRESLAKFGTKFAEQTKAYKDETGQALQPSELDLAKLAKQGATPADMALTVQVYASTFNEAPLAAVDSQPVLNAQRIFSEQFNLAFACVSDWNDAVEAYNVERRKVPGRVVGDLAKALGVEELPGELPYFIMEGPVAPPVIPTLSLP